MVKLVTFFVFSSVIFLGYFSYVDSQQKKQQEMQNIIKDANLTIRKIESNPNNHNHLKVSYTVI